MEAMLRRARAQSLCEAGALAALAVPLAIALAIAAYRSSLQISITYNEGWNAFHAAAVASGGQLYHPSNAFVTNNYPPLSFLLAGLLTRVFDDALYVGRALAWLGFLGSCGLVFAVLFRLDRDRIAAAFGALLFASFMVVHSNGYVGMYDPQLLAHALSLGGLAVLLRAPERFGAVLGGAALISLGLFFKHNVVALPIAIAIWLAIYEPRKVAAFVGTGLALGGAGLGVCFAFFGQNFFDGLLAPRRVELADGYQRGLSYLLQAEVPILIGALGLVPPVRDRTSVLFAIYLVVAILIGSASLAGEGVSGNGMFEATLAFSLACGHIAARLRGGGARVVWREARLWLILAPVAAFALQAAYKLDRSRILIGPWIKHLQEREAESRSAIAFIRAREGPAICETLLLCYWAGKNFELDAFNFGQGAALGHKPEAKLVARIAAGRYSSVQTSVTSGLLMQPVLEALQQRYEVAWPTERPSSSMQILVPRDFRQPGTEPDS